MYKRQFVDDEQINGHRYFYDLGYRFLEKQWGQGFGYEAAQACVDYGLNTLGLTKICAYLDPKNIISKKILEKCGLQFVTTFEDHGVFYDWMEIVK